MKMGFCKVTTPQYGRLKSALEMDNIWINLITHLVDFTLTSVHWYGLCSKRWLELRSTSFYMIVIEIIECHIGERVEKGKVGSKRSIKREREREREKEKEKEKERERVGEWKRKKEREREMKQERHGKGREKQEEKYTARHWESRMYLKNWLSRFRASSFFPQNIV